jgi:hypothetical protein
MLVAILFSADQSAKAGIGRKTGHKNTCLHTHFLGKELLDRSI